MVASFDSRKVELITLFFILISHFKTNWNAKESRFILQSINEKEKVAHELQKHPVLPVLAAAVLVFINIVTIFMKLTFIFYKLNEQEKIKKLFV